MTYILLKDNDDIEIAVADNEQQAISNIEDTSDALVVKVLDVLDNDMCLNISLLIKNLRKYIGVRVAIGEDIKNIREANNLSQQALADKAGINRVTIANIERGKFDVKLETLDKIATAMDCIVKLDK